MYQAQLPEMMIPHRYCPNHLGALAGLPTDGSAQPQSYAPIAQVSEAPVAPAVPIDAESSRDEPDANYRMIRKANGFIFQHSR